MILKIVLYLDLFKSHYLSILNNVFSSVLSSVHTVCVCEKARGSSWGEEKKLKLDVIREKMAC